MLRRSPLCDLIVHSDSATLFLIPTCSFVGFSLAIVETVSSSTVAVMVESSFIFSYDMMVMMKRKKE